MTDSKRTPSSFSGLLPKTSIQADAFIRDHPSCDGADVVLAIMDTGVDPGATGLKTTSNGAVKVIDVVDCTGSGDVDMTQKQTAQIDLETGKPYVEGLEGKKLLLSPDWKSASGDYRVGSKAAFELFPDPLVVRIKADRKTNWEREQNAAEVFVTRSLAAEKEKDPPVTDKVAWARIKELEERATILKSARDSYTDLGPVVNVVSFLDEDAAWRVVVDTKQNGELFAGELLTVYRAEHKYGTWDSKTQLHYGINIYENGDIVSIVTESGAHGTHVAGIAAGWHGADKPELNGVAPGAQIISLKIGDQRLGGMETGSALIRALTACAASGVDVVNMSFGEPSRSGGSGRVMELCRQLVLKHQIVFVSSAGNSGPALSTVGAPGASTPHLIGVAAYVDEEMMIAEYAMREGELPSPAHYTWSSRGPAYDGQLGVSISAPGGAVACVPTWTLSGKELMNGTSMASPSAAGGVCLLLSALKYYNLPRSPFRIRRALEYSATNVPGADAFGQGHGLMQIQAAFECCKAGVSDGRTSPIHLDLPFEVRITSRPAFTTSGCANGLYLREPQETNVAQDHVVEVAPVFAADVDDAEVGFNVTNKTTKLNQINLEIRVRLEVTLGGASWVRTPELIILNSKPASFKIFVDPSTLMKGAASFCEVIGFDENQDRNVGPLFRVPISVIRPETMFGSDSSLAYTMVSTAPLLYDPVCRFPQIKTEGGKVFRKFVTVPPGATWCDLRVVNETFYPEDRMFVLHSLQVRQQSRFRDDETEVFVKLGGDVGASLNRAVRVWGGGTLEICIAQFWSASGQGLVTVEARFSGCTVAPNMLSLGYHNGFVAQVNIKAELKDVRVEPSAELTRWISPVAPNKKRSKLSVMFPESRNAVLGAFPPDSRPTWELRLVYEFTNADKCKFTPKLPLKINDYLYENLLDSQMTAVYDAKRRLLAVMDYGHTQKDVDIEPGLITVICVIRHEKRAVLERLVDANLLVDRALTGSVPLACHSLVTGPVAGTFKMEAKILKRGHETSCTFTAGTPAEEFFKKLPSGCKQGDVLTGKANFLKSNKDQVAFGLDERPDGYPVMFVVPTKPESTATSSATSLSSIPPLEKKFATPAEEQWIVPTIRGRLKTLEGVKDEVLFTREMEATQAMIDELQTPFARDECGLEAGKVALKRIVAEFKTVFDGMGPHDDEMHGEEGDAGGIEDVKRNRLTSLLARLAHAADALVDRVDVPGLERKKLESKMTVVQGEILEKDGMPILEKKGMPILEKKGMPILEKKGIPILEKKGIPQSDDKAAGVVALCEALFQKANAQLDFDSIMDPYSPPSLDLEKTAEEVSRWIGEAKSLNFLHLRLRFALRSGRQATAISALDKLLSETDEDLAKLPRPQTRAELFSRRIALLDELEWNHIANQSRESALLIAPKKFPPLF